MNLQIYLKRILKNNPTLISFIGLILVAFITTATFKLFKDPPQIVSQEEFEASTFIPDGHILIPIEIENLEALNAMIKNYAWVDLYTPQMQDIALPSKAIVKKIRLLRAPLDPNQFGIIVPIEFADIIMNQGYVFRVTLNTNKKHKSQLVINQNKRQPSDIIFGDQKHGNAY